MLERSKSSRWLTLTMAMISSLAVSWETPHAQPRLKSSAPLSYQVGDTVDGSILLHDKSMTAFRLADLIQPETRIVVIILFGGGAQESPQGRPMRGGIWCEDSFDDLGVQRALVRHFADLPVQFLPVAVPPVYSRGYGFEPDSFLGRPDEDETYLAQARRFIEATERLLKSEILPFGKVFYDPKMRLAQNRRERSLGPEFGKRYLWQGKLKWHLDARKYGTPTIWILDGQGKVLREPFIGNEYDSEPPHVSYGFHDLKREIARLLETP